MVSKWDLPLLVVLENNHYAQSTPQYQTLAGEIGLRAEAFGIKAFHGNTWDTGQLLKIAAEGIEYVRSECRPLFLQIDTYRLMAHSKGDDDRDPQEVTSFWAKDPIEKVKQQIETYELARIEKHNTSLINEAVSRCDSALYAEPSSSREDVPEPFPIQWSPTKIDQVDRSVNLIHGALRRNMLKNERILLLGEDIEGPYGGAFKVTKNLSQEFPGRVRNTPISEATIVGLGNGLALSGYVPVCEIMFGDFLGLAFDQLLNHASKFRYMYNDQVRVPPCSSNAYGRKTGVRSDAQPKHRKAFFGYARNQNARTAFTLRSRGSV